MISRVLVEMHARRQVLIIFCVRFCGLYFELSVLAIHLRPEEVRLPLSNGLQSYVSIAHLIVI